MPSKLCRLCLESRNSNFQRMDEITIEIMDVLLVKPNLEAIQHSYICSQCSDIIQKCFKFKSACFYTAEFLYPYTNKNNNPERKLDFKKLYLKTQGLTGLNIPAFQKICRFCIDLVAGNSVVALKDVDEDMLRKCLPELTFHSTKNPVICNACNASLKSYASFIDGCAETEEKIATYRKIIGVSKDVKIGIIKVKKFFEENDLMYENLIRGLEIVDVPDIRPVKPEKIHYMECFPKVENVLEDGKIQYKGKGRRSLEYHYTKEEKKRRKFTCEHCSYRTYHRKLIKRHYQIHADPSEGKWFSCDICTYRTRYKSTFKQHVRTHLNVHKQRHHIYKKCPKCDYKTRFLSTLKNHMLVHRDLSAVKIYTCQFCPYKAKWKASVDGHMRKHEEKPAYNCTVCQFSTKYVESFKRHMVRHADPSELQFLHCAECEFKTLRKVQLSIHIKRAHTDPLKVSMYRCDGCNFQTFYKSDYKRHMVRHLDKSKLTVYNCNDCKYETVYLGNLNRHKLVHVERSKLAIYGCKQCPFMGKTKTVIKVHMLKHMKHSELELFECGECGQTFKTKSNMRSHILRHLARRNEKN